MHNFLWGVVDDGRGISLAKELNVSLYARHLNLHEDLFDLHEKTMRPMLIIDEITCKDLPLLEKVFTFYQDVPYWIIGNHGRKCDEELASVYAQAVLLLKKINRNAIIGSLITYTPAFPLTYHIEHQLAKQNFDALNNHYWIDVIVKGKLNGAKHEKLLKEASSCIDFLGVSYRKSVTVLYQPFKGAKYPYRIDEKHTQNFDLGLYYLCHELTSRYDLPLMIFEKHLDHDNDSLHDPYRKDLLRESIKQVMESKRDGCPIQGYMIEPLVDHDHQGLVTKDLQEKESFAYFKDLIKGDDVRERNDS